MATQERRAAPQRAPTENPPAAPAKDGSQLRGEKLRAALDDLVAEIDEALVENAEEFVTNYVQQGGQ